MQAALTLETWVKLQRIYRTACLALLVMKITRQTKVLGCDWMNRLVGLALTSLAGVERWLVLVLRVIIWALCPICRTVQLVLNLHNKYLVCLSVACAV